MVIEKTPYTKPAIGGSWNNFDKIYYFIMVKSMPVIKARLIDWKIDFNGIQLFLGYSMPSG